MLEDGARKIYAGRDAIAARHRSRLVAYKSLPMIHNEIVKIDKGAAVSSCLMESPPTAANPSGQVVYYEDKLQRIDGKWLFKERRCYFLQPVCEAIPDQSVD